MYHIHKFYVISLLWQIAEEFESLSERFSTLRKQLKLEDLTGKETFERGEKIARGRIDMAMQVWLNWLLVR